MYDADPTLSICDQLVALGSQLNANQYQAVHLAARYDNELEWFKSGFPHPATAIAQRLQLHSSTTREWIRIGHALQELRLIDAAFASNTISYAKVRILTRWAVPDNEMELLALAADRSAHRLNAAIAKVIAADEDDEARDQRLHEARAVTSFTDADGMVVIRIALPPESAKPVLAAMETLVQQIAATPLDAQASGEPMGDPSADGSSPPRVTNTVNSTTPSARNPSADGSTARSSLPATLGQIRQRWQPTEDDDWLIPTMAQQRSDAFLALFLGLGVELTTEIVVHVRADGNTFDDGTPLTDRAVTRRLDTAFIRLLTHDASQRPINASSRRRHPTTRQKRVVMATHNHECVDCQATDLLELDHNPPYHVSRRTITDELEPRCAPCHRARHRRDSFSMAASQRAA